MVNGGYKFEVLCDVNVILTACVFCFLFHVLFGLRLQTTLVVMVTMVDCWEALAKKMMPWPSCWVVLVSLVTGLVFT
jgi:uncharacterized membrane protein (DUF106 family)